MKIAFINIYNGHVDRGAETYVHELAQRLSKKHQVYVVQGGAKKGNERYTVIQEEKINWNKRDMTRTFWRRIYIDYWSRIIALFTLKSLPFIFKNKIDIVIPINSGWQPAFVRIITWIYKGKMVVSGQSGMGWDDRNNLWSFPDYFVALSSKAARWAKKAMPLVKTGYIPNGTDLTRFKPKGTKLKLRLSKPIVLCVGAINNYKRINLVIKAVARLENASLLVVGDGGLKNDLTKLGRKLLGNRFHLMKAPFKDMPNVYRAADLFTLVPDSSEAFGIVYVEALASGLPVVAVNDEQRKEIVGNAGLLVDPTNIDDYAKVLNKALKTNWGDKPKKQAKKFDWDKIADKYDKLFLSLIK